MKSLFVKTITLCFVFCLCLAIGYSGAATTDVSGDFSIDFPCKPAKRSGDIAAMTIKVYECEESIDGALFGYQVSSAENKNRRPIKYKGSDVNRMLKIYMINNLSVYGIKRDSIEFTVVPNFRSEIPAVYYLTYIQSKVIIEGIACLIRGKHYKIGVIYEWSLKDVGRTKFLRFSNSLNLN